VDVLLYQPLSDSDWDWYTSEAGDLAKSFPIKSEDLYAGDFKQWGDESL